MKKILCALLTVLMVMSMITVCFAEGKTYSMAEVAFKSDSKVTVSGDAAYEFTYGGYIGFKDVDMTGIKSIKLTGSCTLPGGANSDTFSVRVDDPVKGDSVAYVTVCKEGTTEFCASVDMPVSGIHNIYLVSCYGKDNRDYLKIKSVTFSKDEYVSPKESEKVPDSAVIDNYHDTWTATDDMGRSLADYEEVGGVKSDTRTLGIWYWDWFINANASNARIPSEIIAAHPESKDDYNNAAWDVKGKYYWSEPLFGYYDSFDYWVHRRNAVLLANAGVDVIFLDYTNAGLGYMGPLLTLAKAFRDAKASGVKAPKISCCTGNRASDESYRLLQALYFTCFKDNDFTDIWFYWDGKPAIYGNCTTKIARTVAASGDSETLGIFDEIDNFFTIRGSGGASGGNETSKKLQNWAWLEGYPQHQWNEQPDGRIEAMSLGVAINKSYVLGNGTPSVFSDEYSKGRGYSEGFGEDYSKNGKRMAYFFREQASLVLDVAPELVIIDGWNEWSADRQNVYSGFVNSFVDTFDDENSRDFAPSRGVLGDDYYNLLVDFVRKYKGVRPAPTASAPITININGDVSQWANVGPAFINDVGDYERDDYGYKDAATGQQFHYTTKVNNAVISAKAARDNNNIYFLINTKKDIVKGTANWMNVYINADRNAATGFSGYDYVIGRETPGVLERSLGGWKWEKVTGVSYTVSGKSLQIAVPRSSIGQEGKVNLEFKVSDGINVNGNVLNFYVDGNAAPSGRFNYLYTETAQTTLTVGQKNALVDSAVIKAGSNKMIASGGKMNVYEADTRIKPFEMNGTVYIPEYAINEIMGYGRAKTEYDSAHNMFYIYTYDLSDNQEKLENYKWICTVIGSNEVRINGKIGTLTAPVTTVNGMIYVPASILKDCFGWDVASFGGGVYAMGKYGIASSTVNEVSGLLK
ncbi:MAG: stalk domain-containing protein [Bacillota bacterium]|nr:stalk domain-containing protein [Bacillota bacterium]